MAWRRPGDKPLSRPRMESLLMHICVTRPQWVKYITKVHCKYQIFLCCASKGNSLTVHYLLSLSHIPNTGIILCMPPADERWCYTGIILCMHQANERLCYTGNILCMHQANERWHLSLAGRIHKMSAGYNVRLSRPSSETFKTFKKLNFVANI